MLTKAVEYPFDNDHYVETFLVGTLLLLGSFLILPVFVVIGYVSMVTNAVYNDEKMPELTDHIGDCFSIGLKLSAAIFVYVSVIIFSLSATGLIIEAINMPIVGAIMMIFLFLGIFYLSYIQLVIFHQFSISGYTITSAFDIPTIVDKSLTLQYFAVYLLISLVISTVFAILQLMLLFTFVGILLIPTTLFYEFILYGYLIANIDHNTFTI